MEIRATTDWQSFFDLATDFTVGEQSLLIQNKGNDVLVLKFQSTVPDADDKDGLHIYLRESFVLPRNVENLYVRGYNDTCQVEVVNTDNYQSGAFLPADIFTSDIYGVRRLSVDSQQTSFEANQQFRFTDFFEDVDNLDDIVYKVETTVPFNLFERRLSLHLGGRYYRVYKYTSDSELVGTANAEQRLPTPMNNNLRAGLTEHPASGFTFTRYDGATFTPSTDWIDMDQVRVTESNSQSTTSFSTDGIFFGGAAGTYWIHMPTIADNTDDTWGYLRLVWEERT